MEKKELKKYYETYLANNPKKKSVKYLWQSYTEIPKVYLKKDGIEEWDTLPDFISKEDLKKLNKKYNRTLEWELIESSVTEEDVIALEEKLNVELPQEFKEFLMGYAFPLETTLAKVLMYDEEEWDDYGRPEDYEDFEWYEEEYRKFEEEQDEFFWEENEKVEVLEYKEDDEVIFATICKFPTLYYGKECDVIDNSRCYDGEKFEELGYLYLGDFVLDTKLFLDCNSGQVVFFDHDDFFDWDDEDVLDSIEDNAGLFCESFDEYLKIVLGLEIPDMR